MASSSKSKSARELLGWAKKRPLTATPPTEPQEGLPGRYMKPTEKAYGIRECYSHVQADVDIVFVHGLNGGRETTWRHDSGVFWPEHLLKSDIPLSRIFTHGYDADIVNFWGTSSQNDIASHAMGLLNALGQIRQLSGTNDRSIIFVAHSLGGIVVEDAITTARQNAEHHIQKIASSTIGIAFLGTPHCGSNLAEWGAIAANFANWFKRINTNLMSVLQPKSEVLGRIQHSFHNFLRIESRRINITCFFEEIPMKFPGGTFEVVPPSSARLQGYNHIGIHKNHRDLGKFNDTEEFAYKSVVYELRIWLEKFRATKPSPSQAHQAPMPVEMAGSGVGNAFAVRQLQDVSNSPIDIPGPFELQTHLAELQEAQAGMGQSERREEAPKTNPEQNFPRPIYNFPPYGNHGLHGEAEYQPSQNFRQRSGEAQMENLHPQLMQQFRQPPQHFQHPPNQQLAPPPPSAYYPTYTPQFATSTHFATPNISTAGHNALQQMYPLLFHRAQGYPETYPTSPPGSPDTAKPSPESTVRPSPRPQQEEQRQGRIHMSGARFYGNTYNMGSGKVVQGMNINAERGDVNLTF